MHCTIITKTTQIGLVTGKVRKGLDNGALLLIHVPSPDFVDALWSWAWADPENGYKVSRPHPVKSQVAIILIRPICVIF